MPAFDYSEIYDVYDSYLTFTGDVPFWIESARKDADVLELMAGTGRISLPLVNAGVRLTCVERHYGMASVLARKVAANVICGDVTALPVRRAFPQILLPFQGLSELVAREEREALFHEVAACLSRGGEFICTAHNPSVRARTLNGEWQTFGDAVEVRLRGTVENGIATGEQHVIVKGTRREHRLPIRFSLPPLDEITAMGEAAGLRVASVFGAYDRASYDAATSPAMIVVFRAPA